jgi:hypothetical protein
MMGNIAEAAVTCQQERYFCLQFRRHPLHQQIQFPVSAAVMIAQTTGAPSTLATSSCAHDPFLSFPATLAPVLCGL